MPFLSPNQQSQNTEGKRDVTSSDVNVELYCAESEVEPAQIFISYQWDSQDEVTVLREVLEQNGFTCWMDIGQMGGGDHLYNCIYDGIKNAKVHRNNL